MIPSAARKMTTATAMAIRARQVLGESSQEPNASGTLEIAVTDATRLDTLAKRFLGESPSGFELVDL